MRLLQLSDCHLFADHAQTGYGVNPYQSLSRVLECAAGESPDYVIITGDVSGDNSEESYRHFLSLMNQYLPGCEWRVIAGNHDSNAHFEAIFADHILHAGNAWCIKNWKVHGLDTRFQGARGQILPAELQAVSADINSTADCFHLLALHHHVVPTGSWMDKHALENPQDLLAWLESATGIALAIHGHVHAGLCYEAAGIPVLSVPSTCWQWQLGPEFGTAALPPGFREIMLSPDGEWTSSVRRIE